MGEIAGPPGLLGLPAEVMLHILSYLEPLDLADVAQACRTLYRHSYDDLLWEPLVNRNSENQIKESYPLKSFRELFIAHHPHWLLTRNRIWFGDSMPSGKLLICRYEPATGSISGYTVTATRGNHTLQAWEKNRHVIIHSFNPEISLDLCRPMVNLEIESPKTADESDERPTEENHHQRPRYNNETLMDTSTDPGLYASFMLCRTLPEIAISEGTQVWPPLRFPADTRTRNLSGDDFNSLGHRPNTLSQVSKNNFRLRRWAQYTGRTGSPNAIPFTSPNGLAALFNGVRRSIEVRLRSEAGSISVRMPETITTYATLPESCYTPTAKKPWQGIWCGDYSGHGCEFLMIQQPDKGDQRPLPEGMDLLRPWFEGYRRGNASSVTSYASVQEEADFRTTNINTSPPQQSNLHVTDYQDAPTGRLEAIKLTGDPNIPRGEYTFIAPDIGSGGLIRIADEEVFRGARVVRSAGHIAHHNFVNGESEVTTETAIHADPGGN